MNDEQFEEISSKVDGCIGAFLHMDEMDPLSVSALFLARLRVLNHMAGTSNGFIRLMEVASESDITEHTLQ